MTSRPEPDPGDLRELVQRAGSGDATSLDQLLMQHLPRLRAFVRLRSNAMVRQHESCSDIVQSVCREVLQAVGQFEFRGNAQFRAWLFRAALNKILERTRRLTQQKRDVRREIAIGGGIDYGELLGAEPTASQLAVAGELSQRMERAFDTLTDDYREVITLSRIVGLSHAEIAEHLGRSEGAVRMLLSRALVAFIEALDTPPT